MIRAGRKNKIHSGARGRGEIKFGGERDGLGLPKVQQGTAVGIGQIGEDTNDGASGTDSPQSGSRTTDRFEWNTNADLPVAGPFCGRPFHRNGEGTSSHAAACIGSSAG